MIAAKTHHRPKPVLKTSLTCLLINCVGGGVGAGGVGDIVTLPLRCLVGTFGGGGSS